jgi:hypothetical protein
MTEMTDFDRRLGDWLEEGPQSVPGWLVEQALEQAHGTPQLRAGLRLPWMGRNRTLAVSPSVSLAAGALGALAVVGAFVLGQLSGPQVGDDRPTPVPSPSQSSSPRPSASISPRPVGGLQAVDVLPGETPDFYALIGLTATSDAVWTVAVTGDSTRLVRIDAATAIATPLTISGAGGMLSPPVADGEVVWTGSAAGLHGVAAGSGQPMMLPIGFAPMEVGVSADGLWVAREGGTSLIDAATGETLREIAAPGTRTGRVIGAPAFGSLWACLDQFTLGRLNPVDGSLSGTIDLPAERDCQGRVFELTGVPGIEAGVIPRLTSVVIDPARDSVSSQFDVGEWSDVIAIDGRLWFLEILRDEPGAPLALVELDPSTGRAAQILTFDGAYHLNTAFESGYLAVTGDFVWVLADPTTGSTPDEAPQIIRIPLSELGRG